MNDVKPVNYMDRIAMIHDVNYLLANGVSHLMDIADNIAISKADISFAGFILKSGLNIRKYLKLFTGTRQPLESGQLLRNKLITAGYAQPDDFIY